MSSDLMGITSLVPESLRVQLTGGADDDLILPPVAAGTLVKVDAATLTNVTNDPGFGPAKPDPVNVLVSVSVVPNGQTLDLTLASHRVLSQYLVVAGDTVDLDLELVGRILGPGDAVYARADAPTGTASVAQCIDFSLGLLLGS